MRFTVNLTISLAYKNELQCAVKDMLFVINVLADLPTLAALPAFNDVSPDLVQAILDEASKFSAEVLSPLNPIGDKNPVCLQGDKVVTPKRV